MDRLLLCVIGILVVFYSAVPANAIFGDKCQNDANCTGTNYICNGTICVCTAASIRNANNYCLLKKKLNESCTESVQCVVNSICNSTCVCNVGYKVTNGTACTSSVSGVDAITVNVFLLAFGIITELFFLSLSTMY